MSNKQKDLKVAGVLHVIFDDVIIDVNGKLGFKNLTIFSSHAFLIK